METFIPKLKQKTIKVVYMVKYPVTNQDDGVKSYNVVLPDKGKYVGTKHFWVPKKIESV